MKTYKNIALILLVALAANSIVGCEGDDFTGHSRQKPTSPVIEVTLPSVADLEDPDVDEFVIPVTMSVAQIVDVAVYVKQIGGDAISHDDYDVDASIIIPKGETEGEIHLSIHTEELSDGPKTVILQIGDARTANADIDPVELTIDRN